MIAISMLVQNPTWNNHLSFILHHAAESRVIENVNASWTPYLANYNSTTTGECVRNGFATIWGLVYSRINFELFQMDSKSLNKAKSRVGIQSGRSNFEWWNPDRDSSFTPNLLLQKFTLFPFSFCKQGAKKVVNWDLAKTFDFHI